MNEKATLRKILRKKRDGISHARREEAKEKLIQELLPILAHYKRVLSFASFDSEIDLWPLNQILCLENKLLLPKVELDQLAIYHVEDLSTLIPSRIGILEPNPRISSLCAHEKIECALIPGLGFDSKHHRLGYGKGHMDRLLSEVPNCMSIGVGFQEQWIEKIPTAQHDQKVQHILLV